MKSKNTLCGLSASDFKTTVDGKQTSLCVLSSDYGMEVAITNYGAKVVSVVVKDRNNNCVDVVTGHPSMDDYLSSEEPYFGAVCGRYANRIANGSFVLDGIVYDQLAVNNGPNSLHGGVKGFHAVVWDMWQPDERTAVLEYVSADGEEGFPGNLHVKVCYQLTGNTLSVNYSATTDKPTVLNLTNHSYFNLSGAGNPTIHDHELCINADSYLPTDSTSIPFGPPSPVDGTPMDFRTPHRIGERIGDDFPQLVLAKGYDHTYVLNKDSDLSFCARCSSPLTGIIMDVYTTEPGVQLYTGNWMTGNFTGKNGQRYPEQSALCLETQHYPDSPNQSGYPSTVLRAVR